MPDLKSADNLYLVLGFIVPGLIVLFVRSQFVTGRSPSHSAAFLSYLTVSVIYNALILPFIVFFSSIQEPGYGKAIVWFVLVFVGPAAVGLLLGVNIQKGLFHSFLQWCGLNPVHVMPTAWDWKFSSMNSQWVLVTLNDGTRFSGFCGSDSFMSSDPAERDIYIERIYEIDDDNIWSSRGENGVLITSGNVRTIEFWPYNPQENTNEQK